MGEDVTKLKKNIEALKKVMKGGEQSRQGKEADAKEPSKPLTKGGVK